MEINHKILEDSKVIKSIFEDEDIDEYDHPIDIHANNDKAYNESNQEIKKWLETL